VQAAVGVSSLEVNAKNRMLQPSQTRLTTIPNTQSQHLFVRITIASIFEFKLVPCLVDRLGGEFRRRGCGTSRIEVDVDIFRCRWHFQLQSPLYSSALLTAATFTSGNYIFVIGGANNAGRRLSGGEQPPKIWRTSHHINLDFFFQRASATMYSLVP
jgi:hypothetical protein